MSVTLLPFPLSLRPPLPTIVGNVDYRKIRRELLRIDELLIQSGMEQRFIACSLEQWLPQNPSQRARVSASAQLQFQIHSRRALRCNIARIYLQESYRSLAARLADSPLLQEFCDLAEIDKVVVPSKSTLQRYAHWIQPQAMDALIGQLLRRAHHQAKQLQLTQPIDLDACFIDSTCAKVNIHYPIDWVLLRDATRTLMKAVQRIRRQHLRHRMEDPTLFVKRMNRLCIEMTHAPRKMNSKRQRKRILRKMDRLVGSVAKHAKRYRQLLQEQWDKTDWTRTQAEQVLRGLDNVLVQLPAARKQARQRIIQETCVANEEKILSLYEPDIHVMVRNKASVKVEFGNTLLIGESRQGLIMDWELFENKAPADSRLLQPTIKRLQRNLKITLKEVGADRGFDNKENRQWLAKNKIYNGVCPLSPTHLKQRSQSWKFAKLQRRRCQTEARISLLLHNFLGCPIRSKGFVHRRMALAWSVLTHNLWVLARLQKRKSKKKPIPILKAA